MGERAVGRPLLRGVMVGSWLVVWTPAAGLCSPEGLGLLESRECP